MSFKSLQIFGLLLSENLRPRPSFKKAKSGHTDHHNLFRFKARANVGAFSFATKIYNYKKKQKKNTTTFIFGTTIHTNIRRLHNTTTFRYDYTYIHKSTTKYNFICKYLTSSYTNVG